ncbi:ubiquinone biosynthesis O-methyltransferase [Serendipita vermifera]|nr:ubiquinone biosynthesis O-methyltransferase [Serendipita vermifera]
MFLPKRPPCTRLFSSLKPLHIRYQRNISSASTVNADEIAHFSRLSEHWWNEEGEFGMLHKMNPVRVGFIRDRVIRTRQDEGVFETRGLEGLNALDIGCGGGLLSESLARLGANTLAIDAADANIQIAKAHARRDPMLNTEDGASESRLTYRRATSHELVEEGRTFDLVCSLEVMEHVDNPAEFLDSCANLVKPGGHLVLSTIARTPLAYFLTIFMAEKVLGMVTPGTHTYSKYINSSELLEFFRTRVPWLPPGIGEPPSHLAELRGMSYNPLSGTWALVPRGAPLGLDCNYILWLRRPYSDS